MNRLEEELKEWFEEERKPIADLEYSIPNYDEENEIEEDEQESDSNTSEEM